MRATRATRSPPPQPPFNPRPPLLRAPFSYAVLTRASRTHSGGDVFDALNLLLTNRAVSIVAASELAPPLRLEVQEATEQRALSVKMEAEMSYRCMGSTEDGIDHADWARATGSIHKTFEIGFDAVTEEEGEIRLSFGAAAAPAPQRHRVRSDASEVSVVVESEEDDEL